MAYKRITDNPLDKATLCIQFKKRQQTWEFQINHEKLSPKNFSELVRLYTDKGIVYTCGRHKVGVYKGKLYVRVLRKDHVLKLLRAYNWKTNQQKRIDLIRRIYKQPTERPEAFLDYE